ncbi:MAG TPA: energy transducer TonB [Pyrinomonadaceae bacterium]|jgi:hypothetical protein
MSKALNRLSLALVAVSLCAAAASAQAPSPPPADWVAVSPEGEQFAALMPKEPLWLEQEVSAEELVASGRRYTATAAGGARYVVWSLKDSRNVGERLRAETFPGWPERGESRYLDLAAEAAWQFLVAPEVERLEVERARTGERKEFIPGMNLRREFDLGGRHAREYSVRLENEGGLVYVCADGGRLYIAAALAPDPQAADSKRFVESFAVGTRAPNPPPVPQGTGSGTGTGMGTGAGTGIGPGRGGSTAPSAPNAPVDYNKPFRHSEVTKKALITFKPEPAFTEWARRFNVTGVVRLRAILSKTGEMTNISVVKYLPHGLTERAVEAARVIRFTPAQKDGRVVSQYVVLEYNYNIY